jgi:hypothetical protein
MGISASEQTALADKERRPRRTEMQTLLILGAGGDLTARLLLPGLGGLLAAGGGACSLSGATGTTTGRPVGR